MSNHELWALEDLESLGIPTGDGTSRWLASIPPRDGHMPRRGVSFGLTLFTSYRNLYEGWIVEYAPVKAVLQDATVVVSQRLRLQRSQAVMFEHTKPRPYGESTLFAHVSGYDSTGKPTVPELFRSFLRPMSELPPQDICGTVDLGQQTLAQFCAQILKDNRTAMELFDPTRDKVRDMAKPNSEPIWLEDIDPLIASTKYMPKILKGPPGTSFYPPSTDSA